MSICREIDTDLINGLLKEACGSVSDDVEECLPVLVVNEPVVEDSVDLVDPQTDQLVSVLS